MLVLVLANRKIIMSFGFIVIAPHYLHFINEIWRVQLILFCGWVQELNYANDFVLLCKISLLRVTTTRNYDFLVKSSSIPWHYRRHYFRKYTTNYPVGRQVAARVFHINSPIGRIWLAGITSQIT